MAILLKMNSSVNTYIMCLLNTNQVFKKEGNQFPVCDKLCSDKVVLQKLTCFHVHVV